MLVLANDIFRIAGYLSVLGIVFDFSSQLGKIIEVSGVFLTVLVIFYPLVVKRNWKTKVNQFIQRFWNIHKKKLESYLSAISLEMQKTKPNFDKVSESAYKLNQLIEEMDFYKRNNELDRFFWNSFLLYILIMGIGILIVPLLGSNYLGIFPTGFLATFFSIATINLLKIVVSWYEIN